MAVGSRGPPSLILDHRWPGLEWLPTKDLHPRLHPAAPFSLTSVQFRSHSNVSNESGLRLSRLSRETCCRVLDTDKSWLASSLSLYRILSERRRRAPFLSTDINVANLAGQLLIYMPSSPRWSSFHVPPCTRFNDLSTLCQLDAAARFACDGVGLWSFGTYRFFDVRIDGIVVNRSIETLFPALRMWNFPMTQQWNTWRDNWIESVIL